MRADILRLKRSQLDEAAHLLARAFFDDPLTLFTFPDEAERAEAMPRLMRAALLNGLDTGMVHVNRETQGAAIWLPPASLAKPSDETGGRAAGDRIAGALGAEGLRRMILARDALGDQKDADVTVEHWHLTIIGVQPELKRRGIGARLLAPTLERANRSNTACYLETFREENLSFYRKYGFDVLATDKVPGGGPRYWTMLRPPIKSI